jgi:hypothetical protein
MEKLIMIGLFIQKQKHQVLEKESKIFKRMLIDQQLIKQQMIHLHQIVYH